MRSVLFTVTSITSQLRNPQFNSVFNSRAAGWLDGIEMHFFEHSTLLYYVVVVDVKKERTTLAN